MTIQRCFGLLAGLCLLSASLVGCGPPPKVMVDQGFIGSNRTLKVLMQRNASGTFDQIVRICTLGEKGAESACNDTVVLENVTPGSLY